MCGLLSLENGMSFLLINTRFQKQTDLVLVLALSLTNSEELKKQPDLWGLVQCPTHRRNLVSGSL